MITVLVLAYFGGVALVFKLAKIKLNPVSIAVPAVIGVLLIGGILAGWKVASPMTDQMVLRRKVMPVVPANRELVSKVYVERDQFVSKGDPLFEIQPDRFEDAVEKSEAALAEARASVSELQAAVAAAEAGASKAKADVEAAQAEFETNKRTQELNPQAVAALTVEKSKQSYLLKQAGERLAASTLEQRQAALATAKHTVEADAAALDIAKFNLDQCTYRSTVDGQVLNLQISEGTLAATWNFTAFGTVMDLSDTAVLAIFPENRLKHVAAGDAVEIAFKRRPGKTATGKVESVIRYTGEGQFLPTKFLPDVAKLGSKGHLAVRIRLDDEELARALPLGAAGSVAIYTAAGQSLHPISKITVRIKAWKNFLPF